MWDLEWEGSPQMAQKSASIHCLTPGDDQVNVEIAPKINENATQISAIAPRRLIWRLSELMVDIKYQL